ncbi:MAG TPA: acetylglutamate kinase [Vicinamibacterales bacterium]|nr:acetylglutamate kinase [Vicinamibacterales bacterium]
MTGPLVLKLGGELIETPDQRARIAACAASLASQRPLAIVHGGGRAIDAELDRRGIAPKKVDGLRVTDPATLDVVVSVLGGTANTELVAALVAEGVAAVGLTGVDAGLGRATRVAAHRSTTGAVVDLGLVGDPTDVDASLIELLLVHGYVPVIASLGADGGASRSTPAILNVNADVMACRLAASLAGSDLVIAGTTPGVLDDRGEPLPTLDADAIDALVGSGTATAGMIAKLSACRAALLEGVATVRILDGRQLDATHGVDDALGTTIALAMRVLENEKQSA